MTLPIKTAPFLLPKNGTDMSKWAVVACDQHTSNPEYWNKLNDNIGDSPSALRLILPEVFLAKDNTQRINKISENMHAYIEGGIFSEFNGFVYLERTLAGGKIRRGIVAAVDLEAYSFTKGSKPLIRASEDVVEERLPPRIEIRENSPLELPHIMLLIDDNNKEIIENQDQNNLTLLYDFKLDMGGGSVKGYLIKNSDKLLSGLNKLLKQSENNFGDPLLFVVGDGNHSLAAAKEVYKKQKAGGMNTDISRYALVEIVNIYDDALLFEPIHRLIFDVDNSKFLTELAGATAEFDSEYALITADGEKTVRLPAEPVKAIEFVERFIEKYIVDFGGKVDYIHGFDELISLTKSKNGIGIALKSVEKSELFSYVANHGVLPKKSFSMGEAYDKRYYVEARLIK